jgi:hypothetical protein
MELFIHPFQYSSGSKKYFSAACIFQPLVVLYTNIASVLDDIFFPLM